MGKLRPIFSIRALTIACIDPLRSARFYRDVLGAAILPTDNGMGWWFRLGMLDIELMPNAAERSPSVFPADAMSILRLEVANLAEVAEWFAQHEVEVLDPGDGQFMQVADPDGLVIEVWQADNGS